MHLSFIAVALAALGSATASPLIGRQANATFANSTSACAATQSGTAPPTVFPDNAQSFQLNPTYTGLALASAFTPPAGYHTAFSNLLGATQTSGYQGYVLLDSYDPQYCSSVCNQIQGCTSINVYIERDPGTDPTDACPNPVSVANFKCSFWSTEITEASATNTGQWRESFQVAIAGSNGFVKDY